jgi:hypothetical protein
MSEPTPVKRGIAKYRTMDSSLVNSARRAWGSGQLRRHKVAAPLTWDQRSQPARERCPRSGFSSADLGDPSERRATNTFTGPVRITGNARWTLRGQRALGIPVGSIARNRRRHSHNHPVGQTVPALDCGPFVGPLPKGECATCSTWCPVFPAKRSGSRANLIWHYAPPETRHSLSACRRGMRFEPCCRLLRVSCRRGPMCPRSGFRRTHGA